MDNQPDEKEMKQFLTSRVVEKPDPLTHQQINQCLMDVEDLHPMRRSAKLDDILTFLKPFRKCRKARKPDFRYALRKTLLEEMQIRMPKSETQLNNEPFLRLGYGVNSYFDIMLSIFYMFTFISIVCIPMFYCYHTNQANGMSELQSGFALALGKYSLGNMGGASVQCESKRLKEGVKWDLNCHNAEIALIDVKNVKYGMMSEQFKEKTYCTADAIAASGELEYATDCSLSLKDDYIKEQLAACEGKKECELDFTDPATFINGYDAAGECGSNAFIYVQAPCVLLHTHDNHRQVFGLITACTAVFIYLYTIVYFDYIKTLQKTKFVDFDVKTITAGDYTVEFDIEEAIYTEFKRNYYDPTNPMGEIQQFKLYVQIELEKRLNELPNTGVDGPGEQDIKIAQITFAFDNSKVINWLKTRGTYIKTEKWEKVKKINETISQGIKNDKILDKMQRPCSVFATMETEEGVSRATQYNKILKDDPNYEHFKSFLNKEIELQPAQEPTDIIWENRAFTPRQRSVKRCIVYTIILIMLTISAVIIFVCTIQSNIRKLRYPKVNCQFIAEEYTDNMQLWEKDAANEFIINVEKQDKGHQTFYTGQMQCLCSTLAKETDKETASEKLFSVQNLAGEQVEIPICKQFFKDQLVSKVLGTSIGFIIIAVNLVLKTSIIALITWIGEDTVSQQLASITNGVFYAQFFNTGILLLIVNANVTEHSPQFITKHIKGRHHDYMPVWYAEVGAKIVQTMLINSILPYVGLVTGFIIPRIKQGLDNKFSGDPYKTKKTSMAAYKDLYSGAEYVIHFKYSGVLNIVYITMMYGMGMPILFVLAAFNFFNQWVCERIIVAYQVKLPPALDDKLTINCINMLKFAPILLLFNGYWMITNKQIYQNTWSYIEKSTDTMASNHFLYFGVNWGTPVLFMATCAVFILSVQKICAGYLMKWGFAMASKEINVDEDLPNFFKSVKLSQADELVEENRNMKDNFLFDLTDPDTIERLDDTKVPKKAIQGTPWYQILSNPRYSHLFYYIGAFVGEREKLIEDGFGESDNKDFQDEQMKIRCEQSDMIMILLNLAFIPDSVIKNPDFNFEPGWQFYFKIRMQKFIEEFNKQIKEGDYKTIEHELVQVVDKNGVIDKWYQNIADMAAAEKQYPNLQKLGKYHTLTFNKLHKFQDEDLESRYKRFKEFRDKELQVPAPVIEKFASDNFTAIN